MQCKRRWFIQGSIGAGLILNLQAKEKKSPPDAARVAEIAKMLPPKPIGVGRPASDRKAWNRLAKDRDFAKIIKQAESYSKKPIPPWDEELYLDYSRTGNRSRFQSFISRRRKPLTPLVIAECLENRGRFIPSIEALIFAFADEKSWALPAHDKSLTNFKGTQYIPDLRSTAMAWQLATTDYWLGDKLSAKVRQRIRFEVERRVFAPYRSATTTGKPRVWWITGTNNWNAVCQAGTIGAALALVDAPEQRAFYVAAAEKNIAYFISGFTADGYCSEGMGYWNYGFGNHVLLSETIYQATHGTIDLLAGEKVARIATFGRRMEILPGIYPAFADCSIGSKPGSRLTAYLNRRFGWGLKGLSMAGPDSYLPEMGLMNFHHSINQRSSGKTASPPALRDWFNDAGILICRPAPGTSTKLGAALKGGHNNEHHNHNDVGSYVVALGKSTPLLDPGGEVYTARTFSNRRYESKVLNSFGHPVPRVDGQLQQKGGKAAAKVLETKFTGQMDTLALDLTAAYKVKALKSLQRRFVYSRKGSGSLTVVDEVQLTKPSEFETALITYAPWKQETDHLLLIGKTGQKVRVQIDTGNVPFKVVANTIEEDVKAKGKPVRLAIVLKAPVKQASIKVVIKPAA